MRSALFHHIARLTALRCRGALDDDQHHRMAVLFVVLAQMVQTVEDPRCTELRNYPIVLLSTYRVTRRVRVY